MISNLAKVRVDRKCPKCGSTDVNRSLRVDFTERVLALVNVYPYRCQKHTCKHRFESYGRN
jgi:hypothetical protein